VRSMFRAATPKLRAAGGAQICHYKFPYAHRPIIKQSGADRIARAASDGSSSSKSGASYGIFVISASPVCAEAVAVSGVDWLCLDAQHGAVCDACNSSATAAHLCFKHLTPAELCCICRQPAFTRNLCSNQTLLAAYDCEHPTCVCQRVLPALVLLAMQVGYETLNQMLGCTAAYPAKRIVRVGGPDDRCAPLWERILERL
jgi:hypothetical protein